MEAQSSPPLTVWETKERDGLLALETEPWREKRRVAEDPDATAETLTHAFREMKSAGFGREFQGHGLDLLAQAIAAHPNTPPQTLIDLLNCRNDSYSYRLSLPTHVLCRAVCHNPVAPLLCLEAPDFWERLSVEPCKHLLSDASVPPFVVGQFARHSDARVAQAARLHITLAGEIQGRANGMSAVIEAEPTFATGEAVRRAFDFAAVRELGQAADWRHRLAAIVKASLTDSLLTGDPWYRSPHDLLQYLFHDGNRLVRWAAQTRLADPDFGFAWHDAGA